jgi:hypothetical protein
MFWDVTPCSQAEVQRRPSETSVEFCRLHGGTVDKIISSIVTAASTSNPAPEFHRSCPCA